MSKIKINGNNNLMKKLVDYLAIFFLFVIYVYLVCICNIPNEIILLSGEKLNIKTIWGMETLETSNVSNENINKSHIEVNLFGVAPVKDITVTTLENYEVVPVGKVIGLKLYTNGILVVGMSEIEDINNTLVRPFHGLDIKEGDTIIKVNEIEIGSVENLKEEVNKSKGQSVALTLVRDGSVLTANITPAHTEENEYKLGLWVKDAATGVGTMTFYEKDSQKFAALGHGITDSDTDKLIDIDFGEIVTSKIISITKSEEGKAGEIKGAIGGQAIIGKVTKNTDFGIYGKIDNLSVLNINNNKSIKVALRSEIQKGEAEILCTLEDGITRSYKIEIEDIYFDNSFNNKSMLIEIIDEELLNRTGGIVRGLSGSPIIQNGKFVRSNYKCISK